jgi:hypothetical protein
MAVSLGRDSSPLLVLEVSCTLPKSLPLTLASSLAGRKMESQVRVLPSFHVLRHVSNIHTYNLGDVPTTKGLLKFYILDL